MCKPDLNAAISRLAGGLTYASYNALANALEAVGQPASDLPALRVAILRNFTIEPMLPVLKGEIALAGFFPELYLADYDVIAQATLDPGSALYRFQPDYIIIAQWLESLAPDLMNRFVSLTPEQVTAEVTRIADLTNEIVLSLRRHTPAPILLNNFPLPAFPALGILDAQAEFYQTQTIQALNLERMRRLRSQRDVFWVDYLSVLARLGAGQNSDERDWQMSRAPLGGHTLIPLGQEYAKFVRALRGKARKCLVLDCDNTLWGGVVGEEGVGGIQLGSTYPGSCYQAFQREILNLHDRGVILAMCSKNNEADVLEVFQTHPDMVLREADFATWQINWDDKASNLARIAQDLNIGLDSLVLADDSAFECGQVRQQLPQIAVIQLSGSPSTYRNRLRTCGYFDTLTLSSEDRERNQMYRAEAQRKHLFEAAGSLEAYLLQLDLVAEIGRVDGLTSARVAQLTQKTNQFNLTTRRYSEGEIQALAGRPDADIFYLRLRDKISDLGLVGVAISRYHGEQTEIDTFLFSCRALGRGAEQALLAQVLNAARQRGSTSVSGWYRPTKKNGQVADFYGRHGFQLTAEDAAGGHWELKLERDRPYPTPKWIRLELHAQEAQHANH